VSPARSSRKRYQEFVQDYKQHRLDDVAEADGGQPVAQPRTAGGARRAYVRDYLRWLRPHWYELGVVFVLALAVAGLQMVEPLFIRFIVDKVILNKTLDLSSRLTRLNLAGLAFLGYMALTQLRRPQRARGQPEDPGPPGGRVASRHDVTSWRS